jgi:hypothetical protein
LGNAFKGVAQPGLGHDEVTDQVQISNFSFGNPGKEIQ